VYSEPASAEPSDAGALSCLAEILLFPTGTIDVAHMFAAASPPWFYLTATFRTDTVDMRYHPLDERTPHDHPPRTACCINDAVNRPAFAGDSNL